MRIKVYFSYFCIRFYKSVYLMNKGFFDMSRRERRGTIVLLALMVVLLLVTAVVKLKKSTPPAPAVQAAVEAFEAETDSVIITAKKPSSPKQAKKRRPSKRPSPKKPKPSDQPRRLDPVPQF